MRSLKLRKDKQLRNVTQLVTELSQNSNPGLLHSKYCALSYYTNVKESELQVRK